MRQSTHCSRDKHLSATTYKQKEIEGNFIPPMPGLLTKKWKCKQRVRVTGKARTKHDKIKLMTYIQYTQQSWNEENFKKL